MAKFFVTIKDDFVIKVPQKVLEATRYVPGSMGHQ